MRWRKSSYSGDTGSCVEVSSDDGKRVAVRDSKNPSGVVLVFDRTEWARFLTSFRAQPSSTSMRGEAKTPPDLEAAVAGE